MEKWLLLPPVAFIVILIVSMLLSKLSSKLALKSTNHPEGKYKSYACGEDVCNPRIQPEYSQFFPFAFFFTIMHVVALIMATVPSEVVGTTGVAVLYVLAALVGLFILFRR